MGSCVKRCAVVICSQIIVVLIGFTSGLNAQTPSLQRPVSKKAVFKASRKALPAVVYLEVGPKKGLPEGPAFFPYYPFLSPASRINRNLAVFLNDHLGTGILIDPAGHILTNAFWVKGARLIRVGLYNRKWFQARLVGNDPQTDLAVLKISGAGPFPHIPSGNSDKIVMGQRIIAIGRYDALTPTLAAGIICAKHHKAVTDPSTCEDFLQTDARIDFNNSGGPLINFRGEILGINDALLTRLCRLQGIGFAVPWNMARHIATQLITKGKVVHGWLGLRVQDVIFRAERGTGKYLKGAMVVGAIKSAPAWKAGVRPGDIIVSYQKHRIDDAAILKRLVSITPLGKTVTLGILRRGHKKKISVQIGLQNDVGRTPPQDLRKYLGVTVTVFPPLAGRIIKPHRGVIISWIDPNGPMGEAGFEARDIILEANGHPVFKQDDLKNILQTFNKRHYIIFLAIDHRTHRAGYVQVRIK